METPRIRKQNVLSKLYDWNKLVSTHSAKSQIKKGGETRQLKAAKMGTVAELLVVGKALFFPHRKSKLGHVNGFEFTMRDFTEEDPSTTLVEQYELRRVLNIFRQYLSSKKINYAADESLKAAASISTEKNNRIKYNRIANVFSSDDESLELEEISTGDITIRRKESLESEEIDTGHSHRSSSLPLPPFTWPGRTKTFASAIPLTTNG